MDNKKFDLDSVKKDEARQAFQPYYTPDISLLPPLPSTSNSKRKSSAQHYEDVSVDSGSNSDDSSSKFSMITNDKALSNRALATPNHRISDQNSESNAIVSTSNSTLDNVPKHPVKNTKQFLEKLYNMLNDPECNHLVHWSPSGTSFIIENHAEFAAKVLPKYFKHNNFPSFIRQLNMYQFSKIPNLKQSVLHMTSESERQEFHNPNFLRDRPDLRILINRKNDSSNKRAKYETKDVSHLNDEIKTLKLHQEALSERLSDLEHRNTKLIKENADHKNKYIEQKQTIDKILNFLASLFSSEKSDALMPRKRRYLLDKVPSQEALASNQAHLSNIPADPNQLDYNALVKYLNDINASSVPRNESYFLDSSSLYNQTNPMYQNSSGMNQAQFNNHQNGLGANQLLDPNYSHFANFNPNMLQQQNALTGASHNDLLPAYINPTRLIEPSTKSSPQLVPQGLASASSSSATPAPDIFNAPPSTAENTNTIAADPLGLPDFLNTFDTNNILDGINLNTTPNQQSNDFNFLNKNS